jgi:hypothetical protein
MVTLEHVGPAQRPAKDADIRPPKEIADALSAGGMPPFSFGQSTGVYWIYLVEPVKKAKAPPMPQRRLRFSEGTSRVVSFRQTYTIASSPAFDLERRRVLFAIDPGNLWEFDLESQEGHVLEAAPPEALRDKRYWQLAYLDGERILVTLQGDGRLTAHVCDRVGTKLEIREGAKLGGSLAVVGKRAIVTGDEDKISVFAIEAPRFRLVATFPKKFDGVVNTFDGQVRVYTKEGCFAVRGVLEACGV